MRDLEGRSYEEIAEILDLPIGTVREVWATGAVDVLVVEDEKGAQQLIPAMESQLREVDIEARRIVIEILPGLLDSA